MKDFEYSIINGNAVIKRYIGNKTKVTIPSTIERNGKTYSVTTIGSFAFILCSSLESVVIPNSVTTIGDYVFYDCYSLTTIIIPSSVTTIGERAFFRCDSLTIYCEVSSKLSGWNRYWNYSKCHVVWGAKR